MDMQTQQALKYLQDKIKEERLNREQALAAGGPKDYAEYRQVVGFIQGLDRAVSHVTDLVRRMEKDDE